MNCKAWTVVAALATLVAGCGESDTKRPAPPSQAETQKKQEDMRSKMMEGGMMKGMGGSIPQRGMDQMKSNFSPGGNAPGQPAGTPAQSVPEKQ